MIIKSNRRKSPSFGQLINYLHKGENDKRYRLYRGFFKFDEQHVKRTFFQNSKHVKKRKNGNYLYHEILSITRAKKIPLKEQKVKLMQIVERYIDKRAPRTLAYAVLHEGKNNDLHYHIVFSANEMCSSKKIRLGRGEFNKLKKEHERWALDRYKELEQKESMQHRNDGEKISQKAWEILRRGGRLERLEFIRNKSKKAFKEATDQDDFKNKLRAVGLEYYNNRGNHGVQLETGQKHRFKTLGVWSDFEAMRLRFESEKEMNGMARGQTQKQDRRPERGKKGIDSANSPDQRLLGERKKDIAGAGKISRSRIDGKKHLDRDKQKIIEKRKDEMRKIRQDRANDEKKKGRIKTGR